MQKAETRTIPARSSASAIAIALAVLGANFPAAAEAQENVSVRLNWFAAGYTVPFYVGVDKGFYEEVGLEVEVQEGQGSGPTAAQVAAGSTTFGFISTDALIRAVSQGAPLKMVASLAQDAGYCVLVKADAGIDSPEDLEGKKYASTAYSSIGRLLPAYLSAADIPVENVERLSMDYANLSAGFMGGQFDAMEALYFDEPPRYEARGVAVDCLLYSDVGFNILGPGLVTSEDMVENSPDVVQNFVDATIKAYNYSFENPEEAASIGKRMAGESLENETVTVNQLKAFQEISTEPLGAISPEAVASTVAVIRDNIGLEQELSGPEAIYTDEFVSDQ